ncbi:MAG: Hsp20/alpha crystallin family protein [Planctomycetes bacterium]|nr:Hsp20/alpha crystallin family protein [Planctomycetota bacterium]
MASEMMKWPYLPMMDTFKNEMNKLFDTFSGTGGEASFRGWIPPLDVSETKENVIVKAEIPGVDPQEINISIKDDILTIKGEKKGEKEEKGKNYHFIERRYGSFARSVSLPASVKYEQTKAEYKNGILVITLPKQEKEEAKKIQVTVS